MPGGFDFGRTYANNGGFGSGGGAGGYNFQNPETLFSEFFRADGRAGDDGGINIDSFFSSIPRSATSGGGGGTRRARNSGAESVRPRRPDTPEVTTVERPLPLTLEELFRGCHKKMKIKRKAFDDVTGKRTTQDKVLEMDIKPGLKKGSKIKFKGVGDQEEGGQQDLHFVIEEVSPSFSIRSYICILLWITTNTSRKNTPSSRATAMTSSCTSTSSSKKRSRAGVARSRRSTASRSVSKRPALRSLAAPIHIQTWVCPSARS